MAAIPEIVIEDEGPGTTPGDSPPVSNSKNHLSAQARGPRGSFSEEARRLTMKASELIIHVPVEHIKKIGETESMNSISRETEHFVGITTVHGPLRVYRGKGYYRYLWALALGCCVGLFLYQFTLLFQNFSGKPTVSQVSFILPEEGLPFPAVTICNYNPVRKSYVEALRNATDFSEVLLDYLIQAYMDVQILVEGATLSQLQEGESALQAYKQRDPNFTINAFFQDAGFSCEEVFKLCSFGGKQFPCCDYAKPTLTDMGKCFRLDLGNSRKEWMRMQTQAGVGNGLQIVADFHKEEEIGSADGHGLQPLFMNEFENGFRYFVHSRDTIPYLATEGISVSPGARVYSALSPQRFVLLDQSSWGNCTDQWPAGYVTGVPYSATNCKALCRARFFDERCGCAPFIYNIGNRESPRYNVCSPYQIFRCIQNMVEADPEASDGFTKLRLPACTECKVECDSWMFHTYNSYGQGFSVGALKWLERRNENWTAPHVKANFVAMNIFFRDMSFTQYSQVQGVSLTETFSDIGGNMGMFMGMSLLSIVEVIIWVSKVSWVAISKKRRQYLVNKKEQERERERRLEETLKPRAGTEDSVASSAREKLRRLAGSVRRKMRRESFDDDYASGPEPPPPSPQTPRGIPRGFVDSLLENRLHGVGRAAGIRKPPPSDQMLELKIDLNELARLQKGPSGPKEDLVARSLVAPPRIVSMRDPETTSAEQLGAGGRRRSTSVAYLTPPSEGGARSGRRRSYSTSSAFANPGFEAIPEETSRRGSDGAPTVAALMGLAAPMLMLPKKDPPGLPPRRDTSSGLPPRRDTSSGLSPRRDTFSGLPPRGLDVPSVSVTFSGDNTLEAPEPISNGLPYPGDAFVVDIPEVEVWNPETRRRNSGPATTPNGLEAKTWNVEDFYRNVC